MDRKSVENKASRSLVVFCQSQSEITQSLKEKYTYEEVKSGTFYYLIPCSLLNFVALKYNRR